MRREFSTPYAFVYRWVISALLTAGAVLAVWYSATLGQPEKLDMLSVSMGVGTAAVLIILARLFDRAKRVWVEDDQLIIYDYNQTISVDLANVERVWQMPLCRPERITVYFRQPTVFGSKVVFFPRYRWFSIPLRHPVMDELEALIAAHRP